MSAPEPSDGRARPRRPASLEPYEADQLIGGLDPGLRLEAAHTTAQAVIGYGHSPTADPAVVERLMALVEAEGIGVVAELWAGSAPETLPGALWRLFALREWIRLSPREVADRYALGASRAQVADVVAGVPTPPGPEEVARLADAVLTGAVTADLDVALDRAAAFYRVVGTGMALDADLHPAPHGDQAADATRRAAFLLRTATELTDAAARCREGALE